MIMAGQQSSFFTIDAQYMHKAYIVQFAHLTLVKMNSTHSAGNRTAILSNPGTMFCLQLDACQAAYTILEWQGQHMSGWVSHV